MKHIITIEQEDIEDGRAVTTIKITGTPDPVLAIENLKTLFGLCGK